MGWRNFYVLRRWFWALGIPIECFLFADNQDSFFASFELGWVIINGAGVASYSVDIVRRRMMMTTGEANLYVAHVEKVVVAGCQDCHLLVVLLTSSGSIVRFLSGTSGSVRRGSEKKKGLTNNPETRLQVVPLHVIYACASCGGTTFKSS
ncbi:hypothetical protein POM88_026476 [Heracleum sosnowskyi]|uniref:ADP/ATP translocase n=1 Tax=Heracleum sosnowskyi TaxID=360622 RepID=A0AAD8I5X8_9APIA|nr:hypothetical protein POM88_026476 [Heracleum sosnowskyi]